ncbi:hypothetical protein AQV86_00085 [Nanohaloarchaea archaeon SG9]|nr:hypothetical protein AQV86_00085 [Nanohaloarchaea archaeon SG9]
MDLALKENDYYVLGGAVLLVVLGGILGHLMGWTHSTENTLRFFTGGAILLGLVGLYRNIPHLEGVFARNMEIIGLGTATFLVSWLPHIGWHLQQRPDMLGFNTGFWAGLFHSWNAVSFLIISYGIYLFHKSLNTDVGDFEKGFLNMHLKEKDYRFLLMAALVVVIGGATGQVTGFTEVLTLSTTYIQIPFILAGLYYVYELRTWGGEIGRNLQLIGVGLVLILLNWLPHIPWHIAGMPGIGISQGFWLGFFHSWVIAGFLVISYALHEL